MTHDETKTADKIRVKGGNTVSKKREYCIFA